MFTVQLLRLCKEWNKVLSSWLWSEEGKRLHALRLWLWWLKWQQLWRWRWQWTWRWQTCDIDESSELSKFPSPVSTNVSADQAAWSNLRSRVNSTFTLLPFPSVNSFWEFHQGRFTLLSNSTSTVAWPSVNSFREFHQTRSIWAFNCPSSTLFPVQPITTIFQTIKLSFLQLRLWTEECVT